MEEKEQVKPLTYTSPPADYEAASAPTPAPTWHRKHRLAFCWCGIISTTIVILGLITLILAFTVFKSKDPVLTVNSVTIDDVNAMVLSLTGQPTSVNATLTANISIKNPNVASFRFGNSTTEFYYQGETLGLAYAPAGRVAARRTLNMSVRVEVLADRVVARPDVARSFVLNGGLNVTSFTDVDGRVSLFGVYKKDVEVTVNCSMTLVAAAVGMVNKVCVADVS